LQIPRGRDRLIEQLGGAGEAQNAATLGVLNRLAGALAALPQRATLPRWAEAWKRLAAGTGLLGAMDDASDRQAWDRLMEAAAESDTLAGWLGRPPPELDRPAACDALLDILASDRIGHPGDESGRVRVLSAESVRSISVPYLFLAGLSERVFPSPDREDRLYSETEFLRLIEAGLPLVPRTERNRQEMLLFYEAVTRATKRLYLSFPALDASGQPLLPSPFLREVEQVFGPCGIPRTQQTDLSPVPQSDEPLCEAELRVKAIDMALDGNVALLAGMFRRDQGAGDKGQGLGVTSRGNSVRSTEYGVRNDPEQQTGPETPSADAKPQASVLRTPYSVLESPFALASNLAAGLELIWLRQDRHGFGPAEGILPSQLAQDRLAAQFPPSHCLSATELERYASCPFAFFMDRILRIKPVEDLALEVDARARGRMVHDVLALLHQRVNERLGRPGSPAQLEAVEYDALLAAAITESLPPEPGNPLQAALREIDRRLVADWLSHYRGQCEKYDGQWQDFDTQMAPAVFEKPFGRDDSPAAVSTPLECRWQDQAVLISGRIDRIDLGTIAGESVFNVIDYKSGGTIRLDRDTIRAGATLQLPLYALAAMELILSDRSAVPWRAGYWYVRDRGFSARQSLPPADKDDDRSNWEKWQEIRELALEAVVGIVQNIRAGRFAVSSADEHCTGYCPFNTVCRINQVRSLEKTFQATVAK
jgi:RecB family exonuclease